MRCWRKMLSISWQEHRTNDSILTELGLETALMGRVAKLKLQYFGHITRGNTGQLALTVLEGFTEGLRHQDRPRRQWIHDIEEWTGYEYIQLKEMSQDRAQWRRKISEWSSAVANPHWGRSTRHSEWASDSIIWCGVRLSSLQAWLQFTSSSNLQTITNSSHTVAEALFNSDPKIFNPWVLEVWLVDGARPS